MEDLFKAYRHKQEFRCTIPGRYDCNCPGRNNPNDRQGYYITAYSAPEAANILRMEQNVDTVDVQAWYVKDEARGTFIGRFSI